MNLVKPGDETMKYPGNMCTKTCHTIQLFHYLIWPFTKLDKNSAVLENSTDSSKKNSVNQFYGDTVGVSVKISSIENER
jgi:hypothetical protein